MHKRILVDGERDMGWDGICPELCHGRGRTKRGRGKGRVTVPLVLCDDSTGAVMTVFTVGGGFGIPAERERLDSALDGGS